MTPQEAELILLLAKQGAVSRDQAFAAARALNLGEFEWTNPSTGATGRFHTRMAGESDPKARLGGMRLEDLYRDPIQEQESRELYDINQRYEQGLRDSEDRYQMGIAAIDAEEKRGLQPYTSDMSAYEQGLDNERRFQDSMQQMREYEAREAQEGPINEALEQVEQKNLAAQKKQAEENLEKHMANLRAYEGQEAAIESKRQYDDLMNWAQQQRQAQALQPVYPEAVIPAYKGLQALYRIIQNYRNRTKQSAEEDLGEVWSYPRLNQFREPLLYNQGGIASIANFEEGGAINPTDRFKLNDTAKKLYDQLQQQREAIIKTAGQEAANKLYPEVAQTNLTRDQSLAMMAQQLASTGITDIYNVKQVINKVPVEARSYSGAGAEGGWESFTDYYAADGGPTDAMKQDAQGNLYVERPQIINTETGEPINRQIGSAAWANQPNYLADSTGSNTGLGVSKWTGATGVKFANDGTPIFFANTNKQPSRWKSFTDEVWSSPLIPVVASVLGNPIAGAIASGAKASYGEGDFGDALKAALLSYGLSSAMQGSDMYGPTAPGEMGEPLGFATSGATAGIPDVLPDMSSMVGLADPMSAGFMYEGMPVTGPTLTADVPAVAPPVDQLVTPLSGEMLDEITLDNLTDYLSTDIPEATIPDYVDDLYSGSGAPTPDVQYPEIFGSPAFDITDVVPPDTSLGDPTAAPGGMPKMAMTPDEVKAALSGGAGDPYIASELAGSLPSSWDPSLLASLGAAGKALLSHPAGRLITSGLLSGVLGGNSASGTTSGTGGIANLPQLQYAQLPEFDITKAFSPTLYAMRQQGMQS